MGLEEKIESLSFEKRLVLAEKLIELERDQANTFQVSNASRLVAYVATEAPSSISAKELKEQLKSSLPDYMLPHTYVFLDKLPMLSNGKLDVKALASLKSNNAELKKNFVKAKSAQEEKLVDIWKKVLALDSVGIEDDFFDIGGDSILSIQIIARARTQGIFLTAKQMFESPTISELAKIAKSESLTQAEQGRVIGDVTLTPIQAWFFERDLPNPNHWNQSELFEIDRNIDLALLQQALNHILIHHDSLRAVYNVENNQWRQTFTHDVRPLEISMLDFSNDSALEVKATIRNSNETSQKKLSLSDGVLVAVNHIKMPKEYSTNQLYIAIHHLVIDVVSWSILIADFEMIYQQLVNKMQPKLPDKTTSYREWAELLGLFANSKVLENDVDYWLSLPEKEVFNIPVDHKSEERMSGENLVGSEERFEFVLSAEDTSRLLHDIPSVYNTKIDDVMLTALAKVITDWAGGDVLSIGMEGHGREQIDDTIDLSRSIGWFTSYFPVALTYLNKSDADNILNIKEQLREIPNKGLGYSALRYLSKDNSLREKLAEKDKTNILYNYLGQFKDDRENRSLLNRIEQPHHCDHDNSSPRTHILEINGMVVNQQLKFVFIYSKNIHKKDTMEAISNLFKDELIRVIRHCLSADSGGVSASDFPDAMLQKCELVDLIQTLSKPCASNDAAFKSTNIESIYPLSPMQEGMLFHSLSDLKSTSYFEQYTCSYKGELNTVFYKRAWQKVVELNSVLRTFVVWKEVKKSQQVVLKNVTIDWKEFDWREFHFNEQEKSMKSSKLEEYFESCRQRGFDLSKAPLMNFSLIRVADDEYVFVWNFHHLLLDGWSGPLVFEQLFSFYKAYCHNEAIELTPSFPYRKYIAWIQKQDMNQVEKHWRQTLAGFETPTIINVANKPINLDKQPEYKKISNSVSFKATQSLQVLARRKKVTLNTIMQGAWAILLSKYSREDDVVFGSTVAGRPPELAGVESMVGLFINTLPVRVKLCHQQKLFEWFSIIQSQQLASREYEYSPLVNIQKWSEVPKGQALFESILVFENYPYINKSNDELGFTIENENTLEETAYPITIGVEQSRELLLNCTYDLSRFTLEEASRLLVQFKSILENISDNPEMEVGEVLLLNENEKNRLLFDWNDSKTRVDEGYLVTDMFNQAAKASSSSSSLALHDYQAKMSYFELNQKANRLAKILQNKGVTRNVNVAVLLQRTVYFPTALLSILKAGGAYLPIDPDCPEDRIDFILSDSRTSLVITDSDLLKENTFNQCEVLLIDQVWNDLDNGSEAVETKVSSEDLAYVIYTSGSTGQPKGVEITHKSLLNLVKWHQREYKVSPTHRASILAGLAFDASVWEIWPYLTLGASLYMPDDNTRLSPPAILDWLNKYKINISFMPTPMAEAVMAHKIPQGLALEYLLTGGDKLHYPAVKKLPFILVNHYGPTENTVVTTSTIVDLEQQGSEEPSIGSVIDNNQVYVLDKNCQPLPIGVPGELYIAGTGLAKGYVGDKVLTEKLFVANPFNDSASSRMYKSGDLVRYKPDGNLAFLGRVDQQVKINGYRIELTEISSVIQSLDNIRASEVCVYDVDIDNKKLVAYFIAESNEDVDISDLRALLKKKLPSYMLPTYFEQLNEFPLTANGKIDRKALPKPDLNFFLTESDYIAARNATENILSIIWCAVLGLEKVGVNDNFFELGGDSILSIQIIARANQEGIFITPKQIFANPTIAELANVAGKVSMNQAEQGIVTGNVPLMPIQKWFFEQKFDQQQHWNQAYFIELPSSVNQEILKKSIQHLLLHHDALRSSYTNHTGEWRQQNEESAKLHFEYIDVSSDLSTDDSIINKCNQLQASLDLSDGRLMQTALFELGENKKNLLFIAIHHLVVDGVSWRILLEDLEALYKQLSMGETTKLPNKTLSFKAWAEKQLEYAQSDEILLQLPYWLGLSSSTNELPVDFEKGENNRLSENKIVVKLGSVETGALLKDIPSVYNTQINDVLLTALILNMNRWTGKSDLLISMEGHGREELIDGVDLSRTIGWFTALYPARLALGKSMSLGESLMSIKEQLRQIPSHGVGFGILKYLSAPDVQEKINLLPKPQVLFNYLGQYDQVVDENKLMHLSSKTTGNNCSISGDRKHLIEINAFVIGGELNVEWSYSENFYRPKTIKKLADRFVGELKTIIKHCLSQDYGWLTPSDFPLAKLKQPELNELMEMACHESSSVSNIQDIYPLSPMQQGMLYHSLMEPESGYYFEQYQCNFMASIDRELFVKAWELAISRYGILRSGFFSDGLETNMQVVFKNVELPFHYRDLTVQSEVESHTLLEQYLSEDSKNFFELEKAPLLRIALFKLDKDNYRLVWSYHHLLLDGWSVPILLNEIFENYSKLTRNQIVSLPPERKFRDYISWIDSQDKASAKSYWQKALDKQLVSNSLKSLEKKQQVVKKKFEEKQFLISQELAVKLKALVQKNQVTLNTLFQGIWGFLLCRYSGQTNVLFGATVSGRPAGMIGVEKMLGLFINTLPVPIEMVYEKSIFDWLKELQDQQLEMREYEYSALVDIHQWSQIPNNLPLFESLLVFENYPIINQDPQGLLVPEDVILSEKTNYPLNLMIQSEEKIVLDFIFDSSRFEPNAIDNLAQHINEIIEAIIAQPERTIDSLPMLTRQALKATSAWNETNYVCSDKCIHELVSQQVNQTPGKVAITHNGERLTYLEIENKANQLANYLIENGVQSESLIGLCVSRTPQMVITMLAILKVGAGYLPLDPDYPAERLSFILDDANVSFLLSEECYKDKLSSNQCRAIYLDNEFENIRKYKVDYVAQNSKNSNTAYVIYTSGSTGKPKGVQVTHHNVVNFLTSMGREPGITSSDILLAVTTLSFDIAVLELFLPLFNGAQIELVGREITLDGSALLQRMEDAGVTMMQATPSAWRLLIAAGWKGREGFKALCGGEALSLELAVDLYRSTHVAWNMYGPTETTVWSSIYKLGDESKPVLIGKPIANTKIVILDEQQQLLPIGVAGEMYIAGKGVAKGYLNRTDLTNERFVTLNLNGQELQLYRTGDLARFQTDGNLEYIDRLDSQVKLRGFRIELGEIESVLASHQHVAQTVVCVKDLKDGDSRLIAYYLNNGDEDVTVNSLRKYLRTKLPDFMIPQHFIELETLPLTPNGKIDRNALPEPFATSYNIGLHVEPSTKSEKLLAAIWRDVLNVDRVSINDNFFELGGHSLLSVQVIARVKKELGIKLELRPMVMDTLQQIASQCHVSDEKQVVTSEKSNFARRLKRKLKSMFLSSNVESD